MSVTLHNPGDIGGTKHREIQSLVPKSFGEELVNEGHVVLQRRLGQLPFLEQVTPELMGHVLPRVHYRRFLALLHSSSLAKPGEESTQYASMAAADSLLPLLLQESIHHFTIQFLELDMFLLKPSTEIGDHHDLSLDRVPRIALLGDSGSVSVKVLRQRPLAQPFNRAWKSEEFVYHSPRMPTGRRNYAS